MGRGLISESRSGSIYFLAPREEIPFIEADAYNCARSLHFGLRVQSWLLLLAHMMNANQFKDGDIALEHNTCSSIAAIWCDKIRLWQSIHGNSHNYQ